MWKSRILLALFIIAMGVYASNYGGQIPYFLFYFSLVIPVICILYTFYVYLRFKFYQSIGDRSLVKQELTDYLLQIGNEDIVAYSNIKIEFFKESVAMSLEEKEVAVSLIPGDKKTINIQICCQYRGRYYVGVQYFIISDPLYLFSVRYPVKEKLLVHVVPRIVPWEYPDLLLGDDDVKKDMVSQNHDIEPGAEVRKYEKGDSLKRIHWKASAKSRELLSKKYEEIPKRGIFLLMDLCPLSATGLEKIKIEDSILEKSLSIVSYCQSNHIPCRVQYAREKVETVMVYQKNQMDDFYKRCFELQFEAQVSAVKMMESIKFQKNSENCILVTALLNKELYRVCMHYKEADQKVSLILIHIFLTEEQKQLIKELSKAGIGIHFFELKKEAANGTEK